MNSTRREEEEETILTHEILLRATMDYQEAKVSIMQSRMGKDESQRAAGANCGGCKSRASSVRWKQPQLVRWQRTLLLLRCRRSPDMRRSGGGRKGSTAWGDLVSTNASFLHLSLSLPLPVQIFLLPNILTEWHLPTWQPTLGGRAAWLDGQCTVPRKEFQMNFAKAQKVTVDP